jgi:hypothetical protein
LGDITLKRIIYGRIILNRILRRQDGWTGIMWLKTGAGGGLL